MSAQIDLQWVPRSQQPVRERESERLWARTSTHTFTGTLHRHTQNNCCCLLRLLLTVITCALCPMCVSQRTCTHKHTHSTHSRWLSALIFQVSIPSFFFLLLKKKKTVFIDTGMLDLKSLSQCTVGNFQFLSDLWGTFHIAISILENISCPVEECQISVCL